MSDSSLQFDKSLLFATGALLFIGLVMVCSASITVADSRLEQPLYFFIRQFAFAMVGLAVAWAFISVRLAVWQRIAPQLLMAGVAMLIMVLIPGIGREVNGSSRWLPLGPVNLQVAELIKLFAIIYIADYLQRHHGQLHVSFLKVLAPLTLLGVAALLLLLQPDMGSMVVIMSTVLAMLFLAH